MSAQTQPAATRREDAPLGVLVGVDGSDQSVSAARWAQREAGLGVGPVTDAATPTLLQRPQHRRQLLQQLLVLGGR